jgi:hypothetical protein
VKKDKVKKHTTAPLFHGIRVSVSIGNRDNRAEGEQGRGGNRQKFHFFLKPKKKGVYWVEVVEERGRSRFKKLKRENRKNGRRLSLFKKHQQV